MTPEDFLDMAQQAGIAGAALGACAAHSGEYKAMPSWLTENTLQATFHHRNGAERTLMVVHAQGKWQVAVNGESKGPRQVQYSTPNVELKMPQYHLIHWKHLDGERYRTASKDSGAQV